MMEDDLLESQVFPNNIAQTRGHQKHKIVFQNYKPLNERTMDEADVDRQACEDGWQVHLDQVEAIERMYQRKAAKTVKLLHKMEADPVMYLVPAKENENIDLKR